MAITHLIIGAGKMGGSLLSGWLEAGIITPKSLVILDPNPAEQAQDAIKNGALHITQPSDIPASVKTVLLGIKPQMVSTIGDQIAPHIPCLLYTSPSPRDGLLSRMPSSA